MNNNMYFEEKKVCSKCKVEHPATNDYFHMNVCKGVRSLYSNCKKCVNGKRTKNWCIRIINCPICNKEFKTSKTVQKYCSDECGVKATIQKRRELKPPRKRIVRKCNNCGECLKSGSKRKYCDNCIGLKVTKKCAKCNNDFSVEIYHIDSKFCSDKCKQKDLVRKKRIYDEANDIYLSRKEVFEIESYKCKSCNCKTSKTFTYIKGTKIPTDSSPTIDHIIPLSLGGTHTLANVQLLCYRCNSDKGVSILVEGEQLKLL